MAPVLLVRSLPLLPAVAGVERGGPGLSRVLGRGVVKFQFWKGTVAG